MVGRKRREGAGDRTAPGGRRDELVRAAFRRVAEVGFEGLRLRQVADDVGIDHSTLHHHVATKQELITAVARYATSQFWSTMPDDPDPAAALRGHLGALRGMFDERPDLFIVTVELDLRARRDPIVRSLMEHFESGWREALGELVARGSRAGAWPPGLSTDATVELIIAVVKGARLAPSLAGEVFDQLDALLISRNGASKPDSA